jgi:hypothetical protein
MVMRQLPMPGRGGAGCRLGAIDVGSNPRYAAFGHENRERSEQTQGD